MRIGFEGYGKDAGCACTPQAAPSKTAQSHRFIAILRG
jgi:hypothetical protein